MIQKSKWLLLSLLIILFTPIHIQASNEIQVLINEKVLVFDTAPIIQNDTVLVPIRTIFEEMGYEIKWDKENKTVTGKKETLELILTANSKTAYQNGQSVSLNTAPIIYNERMFVPIRFIAENTNAHITWDNIEKKVFIETKKEPQNKTLSDSSVMIHTNKIQGSGVIISSDGLIATNYHIIENAGTISILFQDNTTYTGKVTVAGFDIAKDIAIIKIEQTGLPQAVLGNSDQISIGDSVTSISSPTGKLNTITKGEILSFNEQIICNSAPVEHGSSGGGLFNKNGQVIGIISMYDENNRYYAIPINEVKSLGTKGNFTLENMAHLSIVPQTPLVTVSTQNGHPYLFWTPIYGVDGYHVYMSTSKDGEYVKKKDPTNGTYIWSWGYPSSFGVTSEKNKALYFKICSVKDNIESPPSEIIEVILEP